MSALDSIKQNLGVATQPSLKNDIQSKGTTQPVTPTKTPTSAVDAIRSSIATQPVTPTTPVSPTKKEDKNLYEKYAEGVRKGIIAFDAGFVSSVGQLVRSFQWASDRVVGGIIGEKIDTTDSFAVKAQEKTKQWADILKKSADITPENQSFVNKVFEGAGSSATFFIPAVGVARGASVLAKVSPSIAMLFGGSASASLEAMAEAGQVYDEVKSKDGLDKATSASTKTFWANAILLAVTERLGVFNPAVKGMLKKALISAPTEGFQEAVQQVIQNTQTGRPTWEGVLESGAIGSIIGSVMGGTVDTLTSTTSATPVQLNDGKTNVNVEGEKPSAYEALKKNLKPAVEIQKEIEGQTTPPLSPTESPTAKTPEIESKATVPVGEGSGSPKVEIKLPSYAQAQKLIEKEGGYTNATSLPATNRMDAEQLGTSLGLNPKFLYTQATKQGVKLRDFLLRLDSEADPIKRTAIGSELMETLSQKPIEAVSPIAEEMKKYKSAEDFVRNAQIEVPITEVIPTEGHTPEKMKGKLPPKKYQNQPIRVEINKTGKLQIQDGNKRYYQALERGDKKIKIVFNDQSPELNFEGEFDRIKDFYNKSKQKTQTEVTKKTPQPKSGSKGASVGTFKEDSLVDEARKYKTAEEFVKAQGKPLYHGGGESIIEFIDKGRGGVFLTSNKKMAQTHADFQKFRGGRSVITEAVANPKKVYKIPKGTNSFSGLDNDVIIEQPEVYITEINAIKAKGYDAIQSSDGKQLFVFNPKDVQTKSQLIDIWNKANAGSKIDPLITEAKKYKSAEEFVKAQGTSNLYNVGDSFEMGKIIENPFKEGLPSAKKVQEINRYLQANKDKYNPKYVKFYHGTAKGLPIEEKGLLPTSTTRRKSYQSESGYVYLANTPERAKTFGDLGNMSNSDVYEVVVPVNKLLPDLDQLNNLRSTGEKIGNTLGDSIVYGGGVRIKGKIEPYAVRKLPENTKTKSQLTDIWNKANQPTSGTKGASIGRYRDGTELEAPSPDSLKPIAFPELIDLAKELTGNAPFIKKYTKANGMFYGKEGGQIGLNPKLFEKGNERQLAGTFAHEIGHLVDYLPDQTLTRGNLMGRLNTLKGFKKDFFLPAGASRSNPELRSQMWELSKYWRPIDETTATASFLKYRKSSEEIYADFISALFNEPRTVSQIAPTAYNIFFQQLDAKPEVKQAYFELQDLLRNGDLVAKRRSATQSMFKLTEQESKERQIQNEIEEKNKEKSIWFKFKTQGVDITESVREKVKEAQKAGKEINADDNPTYYLEERNYLGGKIKAEVDEKFNSIYQELQKDGMTWEDLGELMFYERILKGDRQEIANPLGYQPDFVKELYDVYDDVGSVKPDQEAHKKGTSDMKSTLGEAKFQKLQKLAEEYRANLKTFFQEGRAEGIYNEDLAKMFEENAYYVPFKGAKYSGVTKTTFGVKQQKGTLGNIENPANTGIEKAVSIIRAIERNKVTRKTMEFMQENFAGEVQEAKTDKNGYPIDPKEKDLGLVTYMKDGKVKGFYVDKYISDAIKNNTVADQNLLISSLRFWNSRLFRPLFITFNLGFQSFNAIRDFKRFWKNVPNMTVLKAIGLYAKSLRGAKIRAFGLPNNPTKADLEAYKLITDLEKSQVLSITYNDIIKGEAIEDQQIERILREVGVREAEQTKLGALGERFGLTKNTPIIKQAFQIMDFIEKTGNLVESIPKIAGVYALEGKMPPREMRSFVRKYVGSPDFMAGGKFKPYMNEVFLFSNAIFQGVRSDFEIATQPKTRGAFWLKTAQAELVPKLLMLMATAGLFGEALKEMFAKIGEYDKTNYTVIPMGIDENGKTVYFRIPSDETGRLIGGLFWKLARTAQDPSKLADGDTYGDLLAYAGGQVPSLTPVATSAFNIREFLAGNNPYDFFRGRPVLTTEQMQAGGWDKTKPFLTYMFQQLGGGVFMKLYTNETVPQNPSLSEKITSLPVVSNIAGRFIKSSDYGEVERIREVTGEVRSEKARENIANRNTVYSYVEKAQNKPYNEVQAIKREMVKEVYNGLPQTPEDRTQARNLEKRFDTLLLRGKSDAKVDALITAPSNDEKVALLVEYSITMKPAEFAELKKFIIQNRVVSSEVFQRFNRVEK